MLICSGSRTVNVLPRPSSLCNETSPPSSFDSSRTIDNPRPVPACSRVSGLPLWRNFSNTSPCSSAAMPTPVSLTVSTIWPAVASVFSQHPTALRRELDGVGQQVRQDLLQFDHVLTQHRNARGELDAQVDVLLLRQRAEHRQQTLRTRRSR